MYSLGFQGSLAQNPSAKVSKALCQDKEHLSELRSDVNMVSC